MRLATIALAALLLAAPSATARSADSGRLAVFAAASLTEVFPVLNTQARYSFAGSDQLAFQIEQGARVDVFAAASPKYPEKLYREGLVQKPVRFATNSLVLIVPKANPAHIRTVDDLTKPGVKIVVGDPGVPVGSYTQTVLQRLGIQSAVMKNVVSEETDVKGIVAKVALGEADAGFVYTTDARTVKGKIATIGIRRSAEPRVSYAVAVVRASRHKAAARAWVKSLLGKAAQKTFRAAGFLPVR
jgi:molybdate transport system substrate-binding protein